MVVLVVATPGGGVTGLAGPRLEFPARISARVRLVRTGRRPAYGDGGAARPEGGGGGGGGGGGAAAAGAGAEGVALMVTLFCTLGDPGVGAVAGAGCSMEGGGGRGLL